MKKNNKFKKKIKRLLNPTSKQLYIRRKKLLYFTNIFFFTIFCLFLFSHITIKFTNNFFVELLYIFTEDWKIVLFTEPLPLIIILINIVRQRKKAKQNEKN